MAQLAGPEPFLELAAVTAGYGKMEILHNIDLRVGRGQSVCLIGPNGAGKSTVLHTIYGFSRLMAGTIRLSGQRIERLSPNDKLEKAKIAYILQESSVFPEMTVEENLWMGGYLLRQQRQAKAAAEEILARYERLAARRHQPARMLSGGERRLLEISRALVMAPEVLLVDEPSIGLEPRLVGMVFELLGELQREQGKTIVLVEQNAKKGLEFADMGCVLVSGEVARVDTGEALLKDPEVGRLFLGG